MRCHGASRGRPWPFRTQTYGGSGIKAVHSRYLQAGQQPRFCCRDGESGMRWFPNGSTVPAISIRYYGRAGCGYPGRCASETGCCRSISVSLRLIKPEKRTGSANRMTFPEFATSPAAPEPHTTMKVVRIGFHQFFRIILSRYTLYQRPSVAQSSQFIIPPGGICRKW